MEKVGPLKNTFAIIAVTVLLLLIVPPQLCVAASVIATDTAGNSTTAFANSKKIVQDSGGNLYAAYHRYVAPSFPWRVVNVARSSDGGLTWTDMTGALNDGVIQEQNNPALAIDNFDNLHMVCRRDYRVTYYKYDGSSWSLPEILGTSEYASNVAPSIAIDGSGNIHVVDNAYDASQIIQVVYYRFDGLSWSGPTYLTNESTSQLGPCLAIDGLNRLHVIWYGKSQPSAYEQVRYARYASGGWSTATEVSSEDGDQWMPVLATDGFNQVHVIWHYIGDGPLMYAKFDGSVWSIPASITTEVTQTSDIAIDVYGAIHVIYVIHPSGPIKYAMCSGLSWTNPTILEDNGRFPNLRWSTVPTSNNVVGRLDYIWTQGDYPHTNVMYNSHTISMNERVVCSTLGNDPGPHALDQDIFKFDGTEGETATLLLESNPPEAGLGERATLVLRNMTDGLQLFRRLDTGLPHEITVTLPVSGEYHVIVAEQLNEAGLWGERYAGDYCITLEASPDTLDTFEPAGSVE